MIDCGMKIVIEMDHGVAFRYVDELKIQQKPLTSEQILELNEKYGYFKNQDAQGEVTLAFVRAIEKIHGIS